MTIQKQSTQNEQLNQRFKKSNQIIQRINNFFTLKFTNCIIFEKENVFKMIKMRTAQYSNIASK